MSKKNQTVVFDWKTSFEPIKLSKLINYNYFLCSLFSSLGHDPHYCLLCEDICNCLCRNTGI